MLLMGCKLPDSAGSDGSLCCEGDAMEEVLDKVILLDKTTKQCDRLAKY